MNPVLSFLALAALLVTIGLQRKELEATREELALSRRAAEKQVKHFQDESKKVIFIKRFRYLKEESRGFIEKEFFILKTES